VTSETQQEKTFLKLALLARRRLIDMHFFAGVGHIGGNLSSLDLMLYLHHEVMGKDDIFILSKGHAAGALYVTLWTKGELDNNDLEGFHGEGSLLSGHPPTDGIENIKIATGSLGHGFPVACGIALARKLMNKPGKVYCLCSDGEWQEGSNWEALIFATHHELKNIVLLIDNNGLQGFDKTKNVASLPTFKQLFDGFGVAVEVLDGHSFLSMEHIRTDVRNKFSVYDLHTIKGKGLSFMEDRLEWHYLPLSKDEYSRALLELQV